MAHSRGGRQASPRRINCHHTRPAPISAGKQKIVLAVHLLVGHILIDRGILTGLQHYKILAGWSRWTQGRPKHQRWIQQYKHITYTQQKKGVKLHFYETKNVALRTAVYAGMYCGTFAHTLPRVLSTKKEGLGWDEARNDPTGPRLCV